MFKLNSLFLQTAQSAPTLPPPSPPERRLQLNAGVFTSVSSNTFRGASYFDFGKTNLGGNLGVNYRLSGQALQLALSGRGSYPYDSAFPALPNSWSVSAGLNGQIPLGRLSFLWGGRIFVNGFNPRNTFKPPSGPGITSDVNVLDRGVEASAGFIARLYSQGIYSDQNPLAIQATASFALMNSQLNSTASVDRNGNLRGLLLQGDRFPTDVDTSGLAWRAALQVAIPCALPLGPVCLGVTGDFSFERGSFQIPHHWSTAASSHPVDATFTRLNGGGGISTQVRF